MNFDFFSLENDDISSKVNGVAFHYLWVIGMGVINISIKMLKIKQKLGPNTPFPHASEKPSNFFCLQLSLNLPCI
jgi:hypothetical protein